MSLNPWQHCYRTLFRARGFCKSAIRSNFESKYADKIRRAAEDKGLSVADLKKDALEKAQAEALKLRENAKLTKLAEPRVKPSSNTDQSSKPSPSPVIQVGERKDNSPVKPLSSILNLDRLLATPHTGDQIGALWTAYHASRTGGTGRGYVCATIPVNVYQKMAKVGAKYPTYVVPLPRIQEPPADASSSTGDNTAYEFYFLQWIFHEAPPLPSTTNLDPFARPEQQPSPNPQLSTILFTPLQEYKLRGSFATPYYVMTHYTDLAHTHNVVLLRGEITPTAAGAGNKRFLMTQEDAQRLSMTIQKYYLWGSGAADGDEAEEERLLQIFHEKPGEFDWTELIKGSKLTW